LPIIWQEHLFPIPDHFQPVYGYVESSINFQNIVTSEKRVITVNKDGDKISAIHSQNGALIQLSPTDINWDDPFGFILGKCPRDN
jgi:hypothetical protein